MSVGRMESAALHLGASPGTHATQSCSAKAWPGTPEGRLHRFCHDRCSRRRQLRRCVTTDTQEAACATRANASHEALADRAGAAVSSTGTERAAAATPSPPALL
eukprot:359062-Chlamydomonas_euryale.AAC.16